DQAVGQVHEAQGDAGRLHQAAAQDEERDGEQRKAGGSREQVQRDHAERCRALQEQQHDGGDGQRKADRDVDQREQQDYSEEEPLHAIVPPSWSFFGEAAGPKDAWPRLSRSSSAPLTSSIKAPLIGSTLYTQRIFTQTSETAVSSPIFWVSTQPK